MKKILVILSLVVLSSFVVAQKKSAPAKPAASTPAKGKTTTPQKGKAATPQKGKPAEPAKGKTPAKNAANAKNTKNAKQPAGKPVTTNAIKGLRNEQAAIKQNIKKNEQALRANKQQVQEKLKGLERINGDIVARQMTIDSINKDLTHINNNIGILSSQLGTLEEQLRERKARYLRSMKYMARQRNIQKEMMFVFSAKNLTQMYRRLRFMKQYAAYQRAQGRAVQEMQERVNNKRSQLDVQKGHKSTMLSRGQKEQQALSAQKDEQQKIVTSLQSEQKNIQSIIDDQKKKDAALNAQIERLVAIEVEKARQRAAAEAKAKAEAAAAAKRKAEELARKKAEAEARAKENARRIAEAKAAEERAKAAAKAAAARDAAAKAKAEQQAREAEAARVAAERKAAADKARAEKEVAKAKSESETVSTLSTADRTMSGSFESNKGRLPSPLAGGRIVSHYGQNAVEGLHGVVLDNKGINILGSPGAVARSIYDGEVSAVFDMGDSYGVLVRHGAYISVYCNLKSVSVRSGQKVSTRTPLGTVGTDNILQFQLRKEKTKLNPEQWISR